MSSSPRLWTWAGLLVVGALWLALVWAPQALVWPGRVFLATPVLLAVVTVWQARPDRLTMLCLAVLAVLFLIAWFI